jgi:hypothetical protein
MLMRVTHDLPGLALLKCEVNALGSHFLLFGEVEQLAQGVLGAFCVRTDYPEVVAAPADLDVQARFEQAQILIEGAAQIRKPRVIGRLEIKFPLGLGR